jgi:hypothetical protein
MKRNMLKICSVSLLMLFLLSQTSYALTNVASDTSIVKTTIKDNQKPNPPVITGPFSGKIREIYGYNFTLTDPDGDSLIKILIEWGGTGDDNTTYICWTCSSSGPKPNGTIFVADHSWATAGNYSIRAKIWDTQNNESDWGTLSVTMPCSYNIPFMQFWMKLFERFPNAFPILRHILGY